MLFGSCVERKCAKRSRCYWRGRCMQKGVGRTREGPRTSREFFLVVLRSGEAGSMRQGLRWRLAQCDEGCGGGWLTATRAAGMLAQYVMRQGLRGGWLNATRALILAQCVKGCEDEGRLAQCDKGSYSGSMRQGLQWSILFC